MKNVKIIQENWLGNKVSFDESFYKNPADIRKAVDLLDGKIKTSLSIELNDEDSMTISGGKNDNYICFVVYGIDTNIFNLIDKNKSNRNLIELNAGGQYGLFPENRCIQKQIIYEAAVYFCATGQLNPSLDWEQE